MAIGPKESAEPVYKTIDSLAQQTHGNIELVVKTLDDHLAIEVRQRCLGFSHVMLNLITGKDQGIYDAFNICMHASRGKYLVYLGCGDRLADAFVVADLAQHAVRHPDAPVIYGPVLIENTENQIVSTFNNATFHGRRRVLPWRNPCHSQGLIYKREWLIERPFRTNVGPLADLIHTHEHKVYLNTSWIGRPLSTFAMGGVSNLRTRRAMQARMRGILANCNNFPFPGFWRLASRAVCELEFALRK
jgi:glycosyltransferase involved in cell wall biosynthesis